MLGHLGLNVTDLGRTRAYFDELAPLVDFELFFAADDHVAYRPAHGKPGTFLFFYVGGGEPAYDRFAVSLQHLAFMVPTRSRVREVHALACRRGNEILDPPRHFPQYPQPYFATFWLDPHGFKLEAVCHHDAP
jgi:catechol 2,3-dioxygenase-like lactoylglutathione lyase family enzyme